MKTMVPTLQVLGALSLLYAVISVHSSYTNKSYSKYPSMDLQFTPVITMNRTHLQDTQGKDGHTRHPSMEQQFTLAMASLANQSRAQDNRGKKSYGSSPMEPQFPPKMASIMNMTRSKNTKEKKGRIFSFSDKDNEISVELGFTIPFITIPIKGMNKEDEKKPLVNINVGAITAGTILTTAALIFIPKAFSGLEPEISFGRSESGKKKSAFLSRMDRALMDYNIDTSVCTQRAVCWIVKSAASKVTTGEGGSVDKIIDGIASNSLLERLVEGTAVQDAIHSGRQNKDCSILYSKCPVTQEALQQIARNFMKGII